MSRKKVLILGATGFIGGHIARKALKKDWEVFGFRRDENKVGHLNGLPIHWVTGDLMDFNSLYVAMQEIDVVFHAAAFYPKTGKPKEVPAQVAYAKHEMDNVIQAAQKVHVECIIYTSTLTTIGQPPPEDNRLADERDFYQPGTLPKSGYYESKIAIETIFLDACSNGLPGVVLNPTAVFGPGDIYLTMASLLIAIAKGWMAAWIPGSINVVDVRDVAEAHISAVERGTIGERYIIGGHNYTIRDAFTIAANVAGVKPPCFQIPLWALQGLVLLGDLIPVIPLPSNHLRAVPLWQGYNTQKAQKILALNPRPFQETVQESLTWLRDHGHL